MCDTTMSNLIGLFEYFQIELKFGDGDGPNLSREKSWGGSKTQFARPPETFVLRSKKVILMFKKLIFRLLSWLSSTNLDQIWPKWIGQVKTSMRPFRYLDLTWPNLTKHNLGGLVMFQPVRSPDITQPITTKSDLSRFVRLRPVWDQLGTGCPKKHGNSVTN